MQQQPVGTVSVKGLRDLYRGVAKALGADPDEADIYSGCFLRADLRHDTQGLPLWLEWALPLVEAGGARFGVPFRVLCETEASLQIDGSGAIGQLVATEAMERAIALAKRTGIAVALVSNGTDMAMAANYAMQALDHGCIGIAATTAGPASVAPWGGAAAAFGTDPLSMAIPAGDSAPIVIDMCCATHSIGTLVEAARAGRISPTPIVVDGQGRYGGDPAMIISDIGVREPALTGAILPEGIKGSALLLMVEVLAGLLTGSGTSHDQSDWSAARPPRVGAFLCAIDIARFADPAAFGAQAAAFAAMLRAVPAAVGFAGVRVPGDHAAALEARRRMEGIAVSARHWAMIEALCDRHGVALPELRVPR